MHLLIILFILCLYLGFIKFLRFIWVYFLLVLCTNMYNFVVFGIDKFEIGCINIDTTGSLLISIISKYYTLLLDVNKKITYALISGKELVQLLVLLLTIYTTCYISLRLIWSTINIINNLDIFATCSLLILCKAVSRLAFFRYYCLKVSKWW